MIDRIIVQNTTEAQENLEHLRQRLGLLDELLRMAVTRARTAGFNQDEFQGLYIDDSEVDKHLASGPGVGLWHTPNSEFDSANWRAVQESARVQLENLEASAPANHPYRFLQLIRAFDLSPLETDVLLIALAPEVDRRYERLYSFLQDDVTRRRPGVDLTLNLLGDTFEQRVEAWRALTPQSALIHYDLIGLYPDPAQREPTSLSYFIKLDSRITHFVLGHDHVDPRISNAVQTVQPTGTLDDLVLGSERRAALRRNMELNPIFYFYGTYGSGMREAAVAMGGTLHSPLVVADMARLKAQATDSNTPLEKLMRLVFREALLMGGGLLLENWISILDEHHAAPNWLMEAVIEHPHLMILSGAEAWEPHAIDRDRPILRSEFAVPDFNERVNFWKLYIGRSPLPLDLEELSNKFRLTGGQIRDAVRTARDVAAWRGDTDLSMADLYKGSRAQSNRKLSNLAEKIQPRYSWSDVVLPPDRMLQLREMCNQVQHSHRVYDDWGFSGRALNTRGLAALFAGVSGTGKTMSADVIGHELGLELYRIDLSTVVSKYIGETEKNLSSIFDEATQSNAILFFDEADALFGKRSEVKDAHDRYANIETGYLLQRMESYDGITILATNLRQNLDEAFTRRLDFLIDFPFPEAPDRARIWRVTFPKNAPLAPDVDLDELAQRYRLAGGNIRNAAMAAAFLAAADDAGSIGLRHILHAVKREYQKMGKLIGDDLLAEFGELD